MQAEWEEIPAPGDLDPRIQWRANEHWYDCGPPPAAEQGWKIYVSATIGTIRETLDRTAPIFAEADLHFKYVRSMDSLRRLNAGTFGYSQIGKGVVLYLDRIDGPLIERLKAALGPLGHQGPRVPFANPFGPKWPLYYRWGSFRGTTVEIDGDVRPDLRSDSAVPEGVADQLAPYTEPLEPNARLQSFLLHYPTFEAIRQQGKFGIFRAFDLKAEAYREVALKLGYRHGQEQEDGTDGCDLLRREIRFYLELRKRGLADLAPALLDFFDEAGQAALALEWIDGRTMLADLLQGGLLPSQLDACWEALRRLHQAGLFLGDAKIANFLNAEGGRVVLLDFETAGVGGQDAVLPIRTFRLEGVRCGDIREIDRLHLLASILFDYGAGRYEPEDRRVDLSDWVRREPTSAVQEWALQKLASLLPAAR